MFSRRYNFDLLTALGYFLMTLFSALQGSNNHQDYNSGFRVGLLTIVATCLLLLLVELSIGPSKM